MDLLNMTAGYVILKYGQPEVVDLLSDHAICTCCPTDSVGFLEVPFDQQFADTFHCRSSQPFRH